MGRIDEYVARIREAIYGRDVRESIASAIEEINDVAESGSAPAAIAAAERAEASATVATQAATTVEVTANEAIENVTNTSTAAVQAVTSKSEEVIGEMTALAEDAAQSAETAEEWAKKAEEVVDVQIATTERAGIVKPDGVTIVVEPDGTIRYVGGSGEIPVASATTLGGIKVGKNLTIKPDGTLEAADGGSVDFEKASRAELEANIDQYRGKVVIITDEEFEPGGGGDLPDNIAYLGESEEPATPPIPRDADTLGGVITADMIGDPTQLPNPDASIVENFTELNNKLLLFGYPDYAKGTRLTDYYSSSKQYTVPSDGFIRICFNLRYSGDIGYAYINGSTVAHAVRLATQESWQPFECGIFPVRKGDTFYFTQPTNTTANMYFYPFRE